MSGPRPTEQERVTRRFDTLLRPMLTDEPAPELFPSMLTAAAARAVGADGAGLSLIADGHRVPIGSSDPVAMAAERLQFTIGEGPCLDALAQGRAVRVDEAQMAAEWTTFHDTLCERTPFRSVVAVPLLLSSGLRSALDVYFEDPGMPRYEALADALALGVRIATLLELAEPADLSTLNWTGGQMPDWVYGEQARRRLRVWIAVGILVAALDLVPDDALARLRAAAYARDRDLDRMSDDLIDGAVRPTDLDAG